MSVRFSSSENEVNVEIIPDTFAEDVGPSEIVRLDGRGRVSIVGLGFGRFAVQRGEQFLGGRRWRNRSLENDIFGTYVLVIQVFVAILVGWTARSRSIETKRSRE